MFGAKGRRTAGPFLLGVPAAATCELLARYQVELVKAQRCWEEMVPCLAQRGCPRADQALCARKGYMLAGELCWLDEFTDGLADEAQWAGGRAPGFGLWATEAWKKARRSGT